MSHRSWAKNPTPASKTSPKKSTSWIFSAVQNLCPKSSMAQFTSAPAQYGCRKASQTNLPPNAPAALACSLSWTSASPKSSTSSTCNLQSSDISNLKFRRPPPPNIPNTQNIRGVDNSVLSGVPEGRHNVAHRARPERSEGEAVGRKMVRERKRNPDRGDTWKSTT